MAFGQYPSDYKVNATRSDFIDGINKTAALAASYGKPLVMTEFNSGEPVCDCERD